MSESKEVRYNRENPCAAKLIARKRLSKLGSNKSVFRLTFDIGELEYICGDTLAVYPKNEESEVDSILSILKLPKDSRIEIRNNSYPIRDALIEKFCITHLTKRFLDTFAQKLTDQDRDVFAEIFRGEKEDQYSLLELLVRFPSAEINPDELCRLLKKMPPRLYSIASSKNAQGSHLDLIIGTISYKNFLGNIRQGVASTYLTSRMQTGDCADVYVASSAFRLPSNASTDIIMVGPGTGLAPFMGFLHEREYLKNSAQDVGRNWLFFGDQHRKFDFLEEDELMRLQRVGVLDSLDLAFSRDQEHKIYVQDRMLEKGEELWQWLCSGACFYVCGDAGHMAIDVENMLKNIATRIGGLEEEEANSWLDGLKKTGRYQKDVY
jgi:sulfite reductase (NADPH) flavoprotein alpha-component